MKAALTIEDLRELCDRYVPRTSRHPGSQVDMDSMDNQSMDGNEWWHAHEIGHMLTVPLENIGQPYFGIRVPWPEPCSNEHELRCYELAAMSISRRLVVAAGRPDLARVEENRTEVRTLKWNDRGGMRRILRRRGCLRLPRTRDGLEKKLIAICVAAKSDDGATALVNARPAEAGARKRKSTNTK